MTAPPIVHTAVLAPPPAPGRSHPHTPPCRPPAAVRPRVRRAGYEPGRGTGRPRAPAPGAGIPALPVHPEARQVVGRVLRVAAEVLDGRRPENHLAAHADGSVLRCWRAVAASRSRRGAVRFGPLRLDHPRPGVAEVAVVVELDGRPRALAARFDLVGRSWRWTVVRLG